MNFDGEQCSRLGCFLKFQAFLCVCCEDFFGTFGVFELGKIIMSCKLLLASKIRGRTSN